MASLHARTNHFCCLTLLISDKWLIKSEWRKHIFYTKISKKSRHLPLKGTMRRCEAAFRHVEPAFQKGRGKVERVMGEGKWRGKWGGKVEREMGEGKWRGGVWQGWRMRREGGHAAHPHNHHYHHHHRFKLRHKMLHI